MLYRWLQWIYDDAIIKKLEPVHIASISIYVPSRVRINVNCERNNYNVENRSMEALASWIIKYWLLYTSILVAVVIVAE